MRCLYVGEAWGAEEEKQGEAFVGASGQFLRRAIPEDIEPIFTNVVSARPAGNDFKQFLYPTKSAPPGSLFQGLYCRPIVREGVEKLNALIDSLKPDVIVPLGNYAFWALFPDKVTISSDKGTKIPRGIMKWRGSQLFYRGYKVMPTIHPAMVLRQYALHPLFLFDLRERVRKPWNAEYDFIIARDAAEAVRLLGEISTERVAVDLETRAHYIACVAIAWTPRAALCIPFLTLDGAYFSPDEEWQVVQALREFFRTHQCIGQNFLYDAQYIITQFFTRPRVEFDTMLAQHTLYPGTPKSLDLLSSLYAEVHQYWKDDRKEWEGKEEEEIFWRYCCKDAAVTYEIADPLRKAIAARSLEEQFAFVMEEFDLALDMTLTGVRVDQREKERMAGQLLEAQSHLEARLENMMPESLRDANAATPWYNSPRQQQAIFYDKLGIQPVRDKKTFQPSVNRSALQVLAKREPIIAPLIEALALYRSLGVFMSNFIQRQLDPDGRMRCSFNPGGTKTFRWSSSENAFGRGTNLQNIPKGDE